MKLEGKVVVITGAARGIGAAMGKRFIDAGITGLTLSDIDDGALQGMSRKLDPSGKRVFSKKADVTDAASMEELVAETMSKFGSVDLFCSNAGIMQPGGVDTDPLAWKQAWDINVMGHVNCARAVLPGMVERESGYFLLTCSAAGLLTALGAAPYAVTKHASVAFAEWLSITYGDLGIKVSALCPSAVQTEMLESARQGSSSAAVKSGGAAMDPEQVSKIVQEGLEEESFLILTQPEVQEYLRRKVEDVDRWLGGMRKLL